jgi:hypothetical protein
LLGEDRVQDKKMVQIKEHRWDFLAIGFLTLVGFLFFGKVILGGKSLMGWDFVEQFYPWKKFIYDSVWSNGSVPFWNPYLFSGIPFVGNIQASMFYPLGLLYYLLPPEFAYGYSTALHCFLGSIFMYVLMRGLSVSLAGSLISALIFSFNGYFMGHLYAGHLSFVQSYVWIPLILHLMHRFIQRAQMKYAIGAGLMLGLQILGGFPQIAFYTILSCLLFLLFHGLTLLRGGAYTGALRVGIGLTLILCVGFALAAVQVLPTLEFTRLSTRAGGVDYAFATFDSLNPKEILGFLIPDIFGNPVDGTYWRSPQSWHFWESCGYAGILPLFLIFIKTRHGSLRSLRIFFIVLILLALFLAFGKYNPLYPLIYRLPGFNSFRVPSQIIFLYVFGIAVLSGIGFHNLQQKEWHFSRVGAVFLTLAGSLLMAITIGLAVSPFSFFFQLFKNLSEGPVTHANMSMLYGRITFSIYTGTLLFFCSLLFILSHGRQKLTPWILTVVASALILTDLYLFGGQFIRPHELTTPSRKEDILELLNRRPDQGRIVTKSDLFLTNDGLLHKFPSVLGYDPLILRRYVNYVQSSQNERHDDHVVNLANLDDPRAKLMKLLNVKRMVVGERILELDKDVNYLTIVKEAVTKSDDEALDFMQSDAFDPGKMVILGQDYVYKNTPSQVDFGPLMASGSVLTYDNERITIQASTNQPAYLVLSEIFYPGWQATVDGRTVPILRGNYLFRVIPLERGEHQVHLRFVSWPFRIGVLISLLTLSGSLYFFFRKSKGTALREIGRKGKHRE